MLITYVFGTFYLFIFLFNCYLKFKHNRGISPFEYQSKDIVVPPIVVSTCFYFCPGICPSRNTMSFQVDLKL